MTKNIKPRMWLRINAERISIILMILGVIMIVIVAPLLFTRPSFSRIFDFSNTGQIGDTIGGITAPITGLIGSFLVYLSFRQQLLANRNQRDALNDEIRRNQQERRYSSILKDIDTLRAEINAYQIRDYPFSGTNAIDTFRTKFVALKSKEEIKSQFLTEPFKNFYFLIATVDDIHKSISHSKLDIEDINTLYRKLIYLYTSKLAVYLFPIIGHCYDLEVDHDIYNALRSTYYKLQPLVQQYDKM